ncbi:site-specific integrase [Vibrio thalassae]|nr:site-specific integrase [Vibrio thalassae]
MRYLSLSKTGIWQFRYQIPETKRELFEGRRELKRSLRTTDISHARMLALEIELSILKQINGNSKTENSSFALGRTQPTITASSKPASAPDTAKLLDMYCEYKANFVSEKTLEGQRAKCRIVLDLLGHKSIRRIRRRDAELVQQQLYHFPSNAKKNEDFKSLSNAEILSLNKQLRRTSLSEGSVKDYMQKVSSFFEWCMQNEYTDVNPFKSLKFRKSARDRDSKNHYSMEHLYTIFSNEGFNKKPFKHTYQYWLPILAYYTGARLNELCQLYTDDIVEVDEVWCIQIRAVREDQRLKNLNSERTVPIHQQLLNLGFIEFVLQKQSGRIFNELSLQRDGYGTLASKWFGRLKKRLGFGNGFDFHSFRHTTATNLKNKQVNVDVAASLLGHSTKSITYDRYGKNHEIELLYDAINKIPELPVLVPKLRF